MPWAYIATFTGTGSIPSLLGAAVSSPASDPPGTLLVVWSGEAGGGPLSSFTYDIPPYFVSPSAPVQVQPANVGNVSSANGPSALYVDGQFFVFYGGSSSPGPVAYTAFQNPGSSTVPGAATQDAPVVTLLPQSNSTFVAFNGVYGDQRLFSTILGALDGSPPSTPVTPLGGAFNGYYSPGVAATPDGAVSILWRGSSQDDQLYYAVNPNPGSGGFVNNVPVLFNGAVPTTPDRPSLAAWVPSAVDGGGSAVLLAVYPSSGQLWYMEASYAGNAAWQSQAPVPVDVILANASPAGGPVAFSDPVAVCATSPAFSDTVFLLIGDRTNGVIDDTLYLVRYTGPSSPLAG